MVTFAVLNDDVYVRRLDQTPPPDRARVTVCYVVQKEETSWSVFRVRLSHNRHLVGDRELIRTGLYEAQAEQYARELQALERGQVEPEWDGEEDEPKKRGRYYTNDRNKRQKKTKRKAGAES